MSGRESAAYPKGATIRGVEMTSTASAPSVLIKRGLLIAGTPSFREDLGQILAWPLPTPTAGN